MEHSHKKINLNDCNWEFLSKGSFGLILKCLEYNVILKALLITNNTRKLYRKFISLEKQLNKLNLNIHNIKQNKLMYHKPEDIAVLKIQETWYNRHILTLQLQIGEITMHLKNIFYDFISEIVATRLRGSNEDIGTDTRCNGMMKIIAVSDKMNELEVSDFYKLYFKNISETFEWDIPSFTPSEELKDIIRKNGGDANRFFILQPLGLGSLTEFISIIQRTKKVSVISNMIEMEDALEKGILIEPKYNFPLNIIDSKSNEGAYWTKWIFSIMIQLAKTIICICKDSPNERYNEDMKNFRCHNDIKPDNIIITKKGNESNPPEVVIADLSSGDEEHFTRDHMDYRAFTSIFGVLDGVRIIEPEVQFGELYRDTFALGVTGYKLLSGKPWRMLGYIENELDISRFIKEYNYEDIVLEKPVEKEVSKHEWPGTDDENYEHEWFGTDDENYEKFMKSYMIEQEVFNSNNQTEQYNALVIFIKRLLNSDIGICTQAIHDLADIELVW